MPGKYTVIDALKFFEKEGITKEAAARYLESKADSTKLENVPVIDKQLMIDALEFFEKGGMTKEVVLKYLKLNAEVDPISINNAPIIDNFLELKTINIIPSIDKVLIERMMTTLAKSQELVSSILHPKSEVLRTNLEFLDQISAQNLSFICNAWSEYGINYENWGKFIKGFQPIKEELNTKINVNLDYSNFTNYFSSGYLALSLVIITGLAAYTWSQKKINSFRFVYTWCIVTLGNLMLIQYQAFNTEQANLIYTDVLYQNSLTIMLEFSITTITLLILLAIARTTITTGKQRLPAFEYQLLLLWALLGLIIMLNANDLLVLYFGIECQAIAGYVLTGLRTSSSFSTEASLKYLLISGFGTALMLFGISFFYGNTSTTNIYSLIELLREISTTNSQDIDYLAQGPLWLAFSFIIIGFLLKIGIAPYHVWMPDVYQGAPTIVVSFFATVPKLVLFVILAEIFYNIENSMALFVDTLGNSNFSWLMFMFSFLAIMFGGLGALMQTNIKRFLAYSSMAHVGYMFLTVSLFKEPVVLLIYATHYILVVMLLFCIVATTKKSYDNKRLLTKMHHLAFLKRTNPTLAWLFVLMLFSSAGLPPLWGFFPKLDIFMTTINTGHPFIALWIFLGSCLTIFVYITLTKKLFEETSSKFFMLVDTPKKLPALFVSFGTLMLVEYIILPDGCVATLIKVIGQLLEN